MGVEVSYAGFTGATLQAAFPEATTYVLRMEGEPSARALFEAVERTLPTDPALGSGLSWDAMADSMFGGLCESPTRDVVVCWVDAHALAAADRQDFVTAVDVFHQVCADLAADSGQIRLHVLLGHQHGVPSGPIAPDV